MAISKQCPKCRRYSKLTQETCKGCNSSLNHIEKYQVKTRDSRGKWKTKVVPSLKLARDVERKLQVQSIEGVLFDKKPKETVSFSRYLESAKATKKSWKTDVFRSLR